MNVVDSSACLSYFAGDGNAAMFSKPIKQLPELLVPTITITEVFKNVLRQLPLADSIIFATAKKYAAVLWTQDNEFEGLENVRYISKKST